MVMASMLVLPQRVHFHEARKSNDSRTVSSGCQLVPIATKRPSLVAWKPSKACQQLFTSKEIFPSLTVTCSTPMGGWSTQALNGAVNSRTDRNN